MSNIEQLVLQAKSCFQAKDYEMCMSFTDEALRVDPGNTEASWLMKEAQRQWEDQRSLEQLEIYVENLKKEAMDLFDQEHYEQCLGMFRFLTELEPENRTLRDYLKLSQQMFVESIGSGEPREKEKKSSIADSDRSQKSKGLDRCFQTPEMEGPSPPRAAVLSDLEEKPAESHSAITVPETPSAAILNTEAIPQSVKQKIIQEYLSVTMSRRRARLWRVRLTAALFLVTTFGAGSLWVYSTFPESRVEIRSTPENASVFIDNEKVGETPFRKEGIPAGSYALRIEKQGCQPVSQQIVVEAAQAIHLIVQLEKSRVNSPPTVQPAEHLVSQPQLPAPPVAISDPIERETTAIQIAQSVIHHHMLGSCTGRLKIDGDRISFWSPGNSQDAFTRKIRQIISFELSEKLLIEFKDKTYRFEALTRDANDSRQRLAPFYEQIQLQKAPSRKPL